MLSVLRRQIAFQLPRNARCFSEAVETSGLTSTSTAHPPSVQESTSAAKADKLEYFVPRNTKGNLPVYTDVRNAGSRHLVLVRNVEGNTSALAKDLSKSLFEPNTYGAERLKVQINHSKHIVISGGRFKEHVVHWLKNKGF